jgi:hypothetical protein
MAGPHGTTRESRRRSLIGEQQVRAARRVGEQLDPVGGALRVEHL